MNEESRESIIKVWFIERSLNQIYIGLGTDETYLTYFSDKKLKWPATCQDNR
jgi:hypothetical protein